MSIFNGKSAEIFNYIKSLKEKNNMLQRAASIALLVKIGAAGLGFLTQTILAQILGQEEYGIYSFFWVWIYVGSIVVSLGFGEAAVKFIAEYRETQKPGLYQGYISSSLAFVSFFSLTVSVIGITLAILFSDQLSSNQFWTICISLVCVPFFALQELVKGFALAFSWTGLAHIPPYMLRQLLIITFVGGLYLMAFPMNALLVICSALAAVVTSLAIQSFLFFKSSRKSISHTQKEKDHAKWVKTAFPMLMADGFDLLLAYSDIIIIGFFLDPEYVALYFAATRISTQVGAVQYAVASSVAQKMSSLNATNNTRELHQLIQKTAFWIFWPTFVVFWGVVAFGWPLLWLFGNEFTEAYPVLIILSAGYLAKSSMGGAEYSLKMLGFERIESKIKALTTVLNMALNIILVYSFGIYGAAFATAISLCTYCLLAELIMRRNVGTSSFVFTPSTKKDDIA